MISIQSFCQIKVIFLAIFKLGRNFILNFDLDYANFLIKSDELMTAKEYLSYYNRPYNITLESGMFYIRYDDPKYSVS